MIIYGFNLSSLDISMLSVCGVLIMALVGYRLTLNAQKHNAFIAAASIFKSKVLTELEGIYPLPTNWPKEVMQIDPILRSKFPKLQSAVEEFKLCLPKRKQKSFAIAWVKYYNASGDDRCQSYHHYIPSSSVEIINGKEVAIHDNTKTYKEDFKRNVDDLFNFAKQK